MTSYFSASECVCRVCEQIFSSLQAFDLHLVPLPGKGCIGPEALATRVDKALRPMFGPMVRTGPGGAERTVWRYRPWKVYDGVTRDVASG